MSIWVIQLKGQDGRLVYAQAKQNGRGYRRKPSRAATQYASQALANSAITALLGRHSEATSVVLPTISKAP